jgi:hypothetical protein
MTKASIIEQGRKPMRSRAEILAWRISLRLAAIPALAHRLEGGALDEAKEVIQSELETAFTMGGPPPEDGK